MQNSASIQVGPWLNVSNASPCGSPEIPAVPPEEAGRACESHTGEPSLYRQSATPFRGSRTFPRRPRCPQIFPPATGLVHGLRLTPLHRFSRGLARTSLAPLWRRLRSSGLFLAGERLGRPSVRAGEEAVRYSCALNPGERRPPAARPLARSVRELICLPHGAFLGPVRGKCKVGFL